MLPAHSTSWDAESQTLRIALGLVLGDRFTLQSVPSRKELRPSIALLEPYCLRLEWHIQYSHAHCQGWVLAIETRELLIVRIEGFDRARPYE